MKTFEQFKDGIEIKIEHYSNGNKKIEMYYKNNKVHNDKGPALIWYDYKGWIKSKSWYVMDKLHRENGPAVIHYDKNENIRKVKWYLNDIEYTHEVWIKELKEINIEEYKIQKQKKEFKDLNI
jgi:hypothetical protein